MDSRIFRSLAVLALASSLRAAVGGVWTGPLAPLGTARQDFAAAKSGSSVYVIGGLVANGSATADAERYVIASGTWSSIPPLPAARDHVAGAAFFGLVYAIGGFAGDAVARSEV